MLQVVTGNYGGNTGRDAQAGRSLRATRTRIMMLQSESAIPEERDEVQR